MLGMPLSLLVSAIPSWAQLGQDRHFKVIMVIEVSLMGSRAKNNHLNGGTIHVQQCTHFKWMVGWVLRDLYTCVTTTPVKIKYVSINPENFPHLPLLLITIPSTPDSH